MIVSLDGIAPSPKSDVHVPPWFWTAAGLGTLWSAYGVLQFCNAVTATRASLEAMGMTDVQAQAMSSYPVWMTVAFAIGTLGGLAGSVLLLLRRRAATRVLITSLVGYVVLYIGDITEGVFAAIGASQVTILSLVVLIAIGQLWTARRGEARRILT